MNDSILVTGGAGYIGAHVCKALNRAGFLPITFDNLATGSRNAVKWGDFVEGDVRDFDKLVTTIKEYNIKAVVHLAAFISVGESVMDPGKYYENNCYGGLTLLKAMKETGVGNIVFSSTAAVYGIPEQVPISEDAKLAPINPYGFSKYVMEKMLKDFEGAHNIKSVMLRYFNVAGADHDGEIGCEQAKPSNLVPIIMNVLTGKQEALHIFGIDYDTPDGTAIRDYIHVSDLAAAHVKSLEYLFCDKKSNAFNLGTSHGTSVYEVVASAERVTGKKLKITKSGRRAGDPPVLYADAMKANKMLNWQPQYTDIDEITKTAWHWQKLMQSRSS